MERPKPTSNYYLLILDINLYIYFLPARYKRCYEFCDQENSRTLVFEKSWKSIPVFLES